MQRVQNFPGITNLDCFAQSAQGDGQKLYLIEPQEKVKSNEIFVPIIFFICAQHCNKDLMFGLKLDFCEYETVFSKQ